MTAAEKFRNLLATDERYDAEAYNFIYEALDWTLKKVSKKDGRGSQHVTGKELLEGIRQYAIEQFGCLAKTVLESWGVSTTDDFGEIVFNLVEHDLMGKQDSDTKEDFHDVFEFAEVFDLSPVFCYAADRDEWKAAYVSKSHLKSRA
ncbi:MAG TPA: Minf_1886 family protein [Planctomycetota bacterium]|nr:Minf_1886 family protein [Planctomycetota bacterium]